MLIEMIPILLSSVKFGEIRWNSVKFGVNEFERIYCFQIRIRIRKNELFGQIRIRSKTNFKKVNSSEISGNLAFSNVFLIP